MRHDKVKLRDYVDRTLGDLTRYHDRDLAYLQAEIDRRLGEVQRETAGRFREQATTLTASTAALDRRLEQMNEFREQVRDVTARKVDEALFRQTTGELLARVEKAEAALERQRGRIAAYAVVLTVISVLVAILSLILNHVQLLTARTVNRP